VHLVTDDRGGHFDEGFPATAVHRVPAATPVTRSPVAAARALLTLARGVLAARRVIARAKPDVIVGFGGYPTVPPLLAAALMRVPSAVHEQNAVMGRANRLLARFVTAIATSVPPEDLQKADEKERAKAVFTGNPVRAAAVKAGATPYHPPERNQPFRLLVFGGSQGAHVFADLIPAMLARLKPALRQRLALVQQVRAEDLIDYRLDLDRIGVRAEVNAFFDDLPERMAAAHLIVCRSGASTVTELAVIGRPAIMVPLPHAIDNDQRENARRLDAVGGGWMIEQADLDPARLASELEALMGAPWRLLTAARAARETGKPRAVRNLANLVEHLAAGGGPGDVPRTEPPDTTPMRVVRDDA
jgi:UDP-N-acetylglucosamine--N-acetylmuramyl-(pentapeptide) pyrophosphoryl-undecaprenol N-acetylglucosamine transferase